MRVYRLEYATDHHAGPFNPPHSTFEMMFGLRAEMAPAEAAQAVSALVGKPGPFDMPGIVFDGVTREQIAAFAKKRGLYDAQELVFGFSSLDQYREWFPHKKEREILFKAVALNSRESKGKHGKWNGLELRCFNVPDDRVLVAGHQVMFTIDDAVSSTVVSRKEATA